MIYDDIWSFRYRSTYIVNDIWLHIKMTNVYTYILSGYIITTSLRPHQDWWLVGVTIPNGLNSGQWITIIYPHIYVYRYIYNMWIYTWTWQPLMISITDYLIYWHHICLILRKQLFHWSFFTGNSTYTYTHILIWLL